VNPDVVGESVNHSKEVPVTRLGRGSDGTTEV
jgi:hypothetical protein